MTYLTMPRRIIPAEPNSTPHWRMPHGRAKLPEPTLALAKLKKVATSLNWGGGGGEREREREREH